MNTRNIINIFPLPQEWSGPRDTVILSDDSSSMMIRDYRPDRHMAGKNALQEYVAHRLKYSPEDRIALVSFASLAQIILPLTEITHTKQIIRGIKSLKAGGGTDIPAGLKVAQEILLAVEPESKHPLRSRHVLLITDGHGGRPLSIARELKKQNTLIQAIGVGAPKAVDSKLLRKIVTTDANNFTHYWFIDSADGLLTLYRQLATGIIMRDQE